jgi:hypothetical protein
MRMLTPTTISLAAGLALLVVLVCQAQAGGAKPFNPDPDWRQMSTQDKIDWADAFKEQKCPWKQYTDAEKARSWMIGLSFVTLDMVKKNIVGECPKKPDNVAGKK